MADCKPVMSITSDYTNISVDLGHHSVDMSVETCPRSLSVKMLCGGEKMGKKINEQRKKLASEATLGKRTGRWTSAARFSSPVCAGLTSLANFFSPYFSLCGTYSQAKVCQWNVKRERPVPGWELTNTIGGKLGWFASWHSTNNISTDVMAHCCWHVSQLLVLHGSTFDEIYRCTVYS